MIHRTAIIHPQARLDPSTRVGPYAVIDEGVQIGRDCVIGPHVYLTGLTSIGVANQFFAGCVIGEAPQDLKFSGEPTRLEIGEGNVFREHVTVHRSNTSEHATVIGSRNFLMQHSHIAHNVILGNDVIIAGGALLAGHVTIEDRVFISGNCLVHQFVTIGTLALMQGGSAISKDLPPFTVARGGNSICGLNTVGLRRAGLSLAERTELKQVYLCLFRGELNLADALQTAREQSASEPAKRLIAFVANSKRGVCHDAGRRFGEAEEELN